LYIAIKNEALDTYAGALSFISFLDSVVMSYSPFVN
jgi:hypothetical protein